jgi:hypothetical protein
MKKVLIAALALIGFSAASFSQTTPAIKKSEPSKMQVAKKPTDKKQGTKVVAQDKVTKPTAPVAKAPNATKPAVTAKAKTKTNANAPLKKDGTQGEQHVAAAGSLKKEGTADMHHKSNKKHS